MDRRTFLGGLAGCGALAGCRMFTGGPVLPLFARGELMRLGVLSDVHLREPGDEKTFVRALEYFRDNGADGVLIAGDIADTGRVSQLRRCAEAWYKVFPDDKAPDGRPVERLFIYGNHCVCGWTWDDAFKDRPDLAREEAIGFADNRARIWRELFHEDYEPIWRKTVKGVPVIGAHWDERPAGNRIEDFMKACGRTIDPRLPFVYTQHDHPKDTCFGSWAWGHDDGRATRALMPFANAVAFSGHSHYTLTDERSVWQGAFTSINTSSLKYSSVDYSLRENMDGNSSGYRSETRPHRMNQVSTGDGRQGMLVAFYDDRLEIARRDFVYGESLGESWVVPLPAADATYSYAARAKTRVAPEFAPGATLKVVRSATPDANGVTPLVLTFPAAKMRRGSRVCEYEVTAILCEDDVDLVQAQRRMISPDFHLPLAKGASKVSFTFAEEDLPLKGRYRFEVRPVECFGRKGMPISVRTTI